MKTGVSMPFSRKAQTDTLHNPAPAKQESLKQCRPHSAADAGFFGSPCHIGVGMSGESSEGIMNELRPDSDATAELLDEAQRGDRSAVDRLLVRHRDEVRSFVEARLDPRLAARIDPSDVVQEAQLEVVRRMDEFLRRRPGPCRWWVRSTASERLPHVPRGHLKRAKRSVRREVPLPERSSLLLAKPLLAGGRTPSQSLEARELAERVAEAVAGLSEADREVLL